MMLVVSTQVHENYGAHDWDGVGVCPQYWKAKGGHEYKILGIPAGIDFQEIVELVTPEIETANDYITESIIDVRCEADDYLSWFEKSQLDYEGSIQFAEPTIEYGDLVARSAE